MKNKQDELLVYKEENKELRKLLWLRHAIGHILYGDDGELQCNTCQIDFKEDSVDEISMKFLKQNMKKIRSNQS